MILDDLGLVPTLRRYTEIIAESCDSLIKLTVTGMERRISPSTEIALFRVVQEAVRNALRHAQPTAVHLTLEMEPLTIRVTIRDNGRGCDQGAAIGGARSGRNVGLARMEELARSIGGSFEFDSAAGDGTAVTVSVPVTVQPDRLG